MTYKIIDDFLPYDKFIEIQKNMLGADIAWAFNSLAVRSEHVELSNLNNYQFTHTFYKQNCPRSNWINLLDPVIDILNPSAIVRIKANLMPRTDEQVIHDYHFDHEFFDGKIAIFYINTNNGYTIFEDGTKIDSIENRLVIFDNIRHTGTTCTDQKVRCLINFMFYQWTDATI